MEFWPVNSIERESPSSTECQQRLKMPWPIISLSENHFSRSLILLKQKRIHDLLAMH